MTNTEFKMTEEQWGAVLRHWGFSWGQCCDLWWDERTQSKDKDFAEFARGFTGTKACVHFVGVPARQRPTAVRMWGQPDFEHPTATFRVLGECAPHDTVVFGDSAFVKPKKWRSAR